MLQEEVQRIINDVAREKGIDAKIIEKGFKNQFQVVRDTIANSYDRKEYSIVYVKYLGKFVPHRKYIDLRDGFRDRKKAEGDSRWMGELSDKGSDNGEGTVEKGRIL